jgi:hypothetical protein
MKIKDMPLFSFVETPSYREGFIVAIKKYKRWEWEVIRLYINPSGKMSFDNGWVGETHEVTQKEPDKKQFIEAAFEDMNNDPLLKQYIRDWGVDERE